MNRLVGRRETVVHEERGVTRDRKQLELEWNGAAIEIVDTGGIDVVAHGDPITRQVTEQARVALAEADLVLFVVDAQVGVTSGDIEVAQIIRRSRTPVILVANKADNPRRELLDAAELYELGLGDPFPISAIQGTNSGDLLDLIVERLRASRARRATCAWPTRSVSRSWAGRTSASRAC